MHELNRREFRRKLDLFPPEMSHAVMLAAGIIGAEMAKRVEETPEGVVQDGEGFVSDLLDVVDPLQEETFPDLLERYLVETMKDELRLCCSNCTNFNSCIDIGSLELGALFLRRVNGDDSDKLKKELSRQINDALKKTPYPDDAHMSCDRFRHQYSPATISEVFNRYADIAAGLQQQYGLDYRKFQQNMISMNMDFCEKFR